MKSKLSLCLAVLVLLSMLLSACTPAATPTPAAAEKPTAAPAAAEKPTTAPAAPEKPAEAKVVKIGVAVSMTGAVSREGTFEKNGIDYWAELVNDAGGFDVAGEKYKVELVYYDDQSNPETSMKLTEKLITEDKVQFLIGPYSSGIQTAAATIGEKYKIITITPLANATTIYSKGYKYIFSVLPPATKYLQRLMDLAVTLDPAPQTIAIMVRDDPFGNSVAEGVKTRAEENGLKVVYYEKFPKDVTDVSAMLSAIKALNPDIVVASTLYQDAVLITKQAKDLQLCPKMLSYSVGVSIPDFTKDLGPDADGIFGAEWWLPNMGWKGEVIPSAEEFAAAIKAKYGYTPSYHAAGGAAAGLILQLAIQDAGSLETEKVRQALLNFKHDLFWGPTAWDETGANIAGASGVIQIQNGQVVSIYPKEIQQAPPIYPMPCWTER